MVDRGRFVIYIKPRSIPTPEQGMLRNDHRRPSVAKSDTRTAGKRAVLTVLERFLVLSEVMLPTLGTDTTVAGGNKQILNQPNITSLAANLVSTRLI